MRIFVSELLCSGAWPEPDLDASLAREGRSMLSALLEDFATLPEIRVVTTWDCRLGRFPLVDTVDVHEVRDPAEEEAWFHRLAAESSATIVIAPEFDGLLAGRIRVVREVGGTHLGCQPEAIDLCGDKLRVAEHLKAHGIRTVETHSFDAMTSAAAMTFPAVVKPRFGAGSQHTFLVRNVMELERIQTELPASLWGGAMIAQPFIPGRAVSVGLIVGDTRRNIEVLPPGDQLLSRDGRFRYLGGRIPADLNRSTREAVEHESRRIVECTDGLQGWIGMDFILPADAPDQPILVDINPRLTTAYLGYRNVATENLAKRLLFPEKVGSHVRCQERIVTFTADGECRVA